MTTTRGSGREAGMEGFLGDVAHTVAAHPKATAAGISAVIVIAIIRAVIASSYRYR